MEKAIACPVCGRSNSCRAGEGNCWCMAEEFPPELLEAVNKVHGNKKCICLTCVRLYKKDPDKFLKINSLQTY